MRVINEQEMRWVGGGYDSYGPGFPGYSEEQGQEALANLEWNFDMDNRTFYLDQPTIGMQVVAEDWWGGSTLNYDPYSDRSFADLDNDGYGDVEIFSTPSGLTADLDGDGYGETLVAPN